MYWLLVILQSLWVPCLQGIPGRPFVHALGESMVPERFGAPIQCGWMSVHPVLVDGFCKMTMLSTRSLRAQLAIFGARIRPWAGDYWGAC